MNIICCSKKQTEEIRAPQDQIDLALEVIQEEDTVAPQQEQMEDISHLLGPPAMGLITPSAPSTYNNGIILSTLIEGRRLNTKSFVDNINAESVHRRPISRSPGIENLANERLKPISPHMGRN